MGLKGRLRHIYTETETVLGTPPRVKVSIPALDLDACAITVPRVRFVPGVG